jgi:hypothetical protein
LARPARGSRHLTDARAALERLDALARRFGLSGGLAAMGLAEVEPADMERDTLHRFVKATDSDLDASAALDGIFELTRRERGSGRRRRRVRWPPGRGGGGVVRCPRTAPAPA